MKGFIPPSEKFPTGGAHCIAAYYVPRIRRLPLVDLHVLTCPSLQVTSFKASEEFYHKVDAADKEFKPFEVRA